MTASTRRPVKRRSTWILVGVAALIIAGLGWWLSQRPPADGRAGPPGGFGGRGAAQATPVRVVAAEQGAVARLLDAIGTITPSAIVTVRPRVDGLLESVAFHDGQRVREGEILARIDARPFQIQLEQALGQQAQRAAQLANAQRDLARYEQLYKQDSVARQQLDTARAQVQELQAQARVDQAAVEDARRQLGYTEIIAPIDGRLGLRKVDPGNMVNASDAEGLVTIARSQPIDVVFSAAQTQLAAILQARAQAGSLRVQALAREGAQVLAEGELVAIDNQIDVATGTVALKGRFANPDERLFPNQFVNVRLFLGQETGIVVPVRAVQRGSVGSFVYRVDAQQRAHVAVVHTGATDGERIVITDGLQAGDQVVVEGTDRLRDDSPVEIVAEQAAAPGNAGR